MIGPRHAHAVSFLAILDTMWGTTGRAPHWFPINPDNHSGRRLYTLTGASDWTIWVTNACPQQTNHASKHGAPSVEWLSECLHSLWQREQRLPLLVCGRIAQATSTMLEERGYTHRGPVLRMMHPAARAWTHEKIRAAQRSIRRLK